MDYTSTHFLILAGLALAFLAWVLTQYVRFRRHGGRRKDESS